MLLVGYPTKNYALLAIQFLQQTFAEEANPACYQFSCYRIAPWHLENLEPFCRQNQLNFRVERRIENWRKVFTYFRLINSADATLSTTSFMFNTCKNRPSGDTSHLRKISCQLYNEYQNKLFLSSLFPVPFHNNVPYAV